MSGNLVFLAVAILCFTITWACLGLIVVRLIAAYQEESELWYYEHELPEGVASCDVCGSADPDMRKHQKCMDAFGWDEVDYDRQEDFWQKDEYYDGR